MGASYPKSINHNPNLDLRVFSPSLSKIYIFVCVINPPTLLYLHFLSEILEQVWGP